LKICGELRQLVLQNHKMAQSLLICSFLQALRFARVHPHPLILSNSSVDGTLKVSLQIPIHSQIEWLMCGKALKIVSDSHKYDKF
jgi:hypothetical protein